MYCRWRSRGRLIAAQSEFDKETVAEMKRGCSTGVVGLARPLTGDGATAEAEGWMPLYLRLSSD